MNLLQADSEPVLQRRRLTTAIGIGLVVMTATVFWQVRRFEFVSLDDAFYVTENPYVSSGLSSENLRWAFTTSAIANWHPFTWLSLMLDVQLFGRNAGAMHLTNVALHCANALLLFVVLRLATGSVWRSGFVAALFAVHPLHVESVAWVSERKDVLSTFFGFLAIWWYIRYARGGRQSSYWACAALWVCSLLSKQMFVTLPFVLLLLDYWPLGRFDESDWKAAGRRLVKEKIPLFGMTVVFCLVAFAFQYRGGAVHSFDKFSVPTRAANAAVAYVLYLEKTFWPRHLAAFYPHPGDAISLWQALAAACLLITVTVWAFRSARIRPYALVGWLWYLGTLVPVIGLVQIGDQQMADRYTYLPLVGIFIAVTWLVAEEGSHQAWLGRILPFAAAGIVAALSIVTWRQAGTWRDSEHLFAHAVAVTGPNAFAEDTLGNVYRLQGRRAAARRQFARALAIDPRAKSALNDFGKLMLEEGQYERALEYHRQALDVDPRDNMTHDFMATVLFQMGRGDEAREHLQEALRIDPLDFYAHHNLGNILTATGRKEEALQCFQTAAQIDPRSALARHSLGSVLIDLGRFDEAEANFRAALRLDPGSASAHANLAAILHGRQNFEEALFHFQRAFALDPSADAIRENLAAEYVNVGTELASRSMTDQAIESFRNAVRLAPRNLDANYRLARALAQNHQLQEAVQYFEKAVPLGPDVAEIHFDYAVVLRELGSRDRAIEQIKEALRINPDFKAARIELARLTQEK